MGYEHDTYISPATWRYGSEEMKSVFSEKHKRILLRRIWVAIAGAENKAGLVTDSELKELEDHSEDIDIERSSEIEKEISHDLMAEIKTYAEKCPTAGGKIHMGATSMDILDNADAVRFREAMEIIRTKLSALIISMSKIARDFADYPTMAFTHIQPAEITTVGYRLSQTLQDLTDDYISIVKTRDGIKGKGIKGAVGTAASFCSLLEGSGVTAEELEESVMEELGIEAFDASTQVYTRKQDLMIISCLSSLAATLHKFSLDMRILQSPVIGEVSEPFGKKQVGSSAMPFKRNPVNNEKICSLARIVESAYQNAWNNASEMILERTLDDSASRRLFIPEAFIASDEILITANKIISGMSIHTERSKKLIDDYGIFSATERILMEAVKRGADRQEAHERIRLLSMEAWDRLQSGGQNGLKKSLLNDSFLLSYLSRDEIESLTDASQYIGRAPDITETVVEKALRTVRELI